VLAFVPYVPTPPRETASPQAQDLANRIASLIADYQCSHPDLGACDVEDALRAAAGGDDAGRAVRSVRRVSALVLGGVVAALLGAGVYIQQRGGAPWSGVGVVAAIAIGLAVVTVLRRRS
jgi:hypothetical protein